MAKQKFEHQRINLNFPIYLSKAIVSVCGYMND